MNHFISHSSHLLPRNLAILSLIEEGTFLVASPIISKALITAYVVLVSLIKSS
jgi:hypothetical protein